MASSYIAKDILCPFYVKDDQRVLTCEGFPETLSHNQVFKNRDSLLKHASIYCSTWNYHCCEVYRLIMESKYNDER